LEVTRFDPTFFEPKSQKHPHCLKSQLRRTRKEMVIGTRVVKTVVFKACVLLVQAVSPAQQK
jgi:hypothetical protein